MKREPPEPSRGEGAAPTSARQPAAPYGRKPTGRGAAAGWLPPLRARYRLQRAHGERASASWPGRRSGAGRANRRAKVTGVGPERRALSGAAPPGSSGSTLERRSLCRHGGPDGKGQAPGARREPPRE
jgi:hypothetical protein